MQLRSLRGAWAALVGASMLGPACGGSIAPIAGGDAGAAASSSGGGSSGGSPTDAGQVLDSPATPDSATLTCEVDGVPCATASQCCSAVCQNGVCGMEPACQEDGMPCSQGSQCCGGLCVGTTCGVTTPACAADGASCVDASQCCSGACNAEVCGAVVCTVPADAGPCGECLAQSCCPQLAACVADTTCLGSVQCFTACYGGPGTGAACAAKCLGPSPSTQAGQLEQCAASSCSACD
jgi:hypothetical protein